MKDSENLSDNSMLHPLVIKATTSWCFLYNIHMSQYIPCTYGHGENVIPVGIFTFLVQKVQEPKIPKVTKADLYDHYMLKTIPILIALAAAKYKSLSYGNSGKSKG